MNLEKEFDYAYDLLMKRFRINFKKPKIETGNYVGSEYVKLNSKKDLERALSAPPIMLFDDKKNLIFIPIQGLEQEHSKVRLYYFLHESCHSLLCQINNSFFEDNILNLIKENKTKEKGEVFLAFDEGLADYMSIESCYISTDQKLKEIGDKRNKTLTDSLNNWINRKDFHLMAQIYGYNKNEWQKTLNKYFRRNKGMLAFASCYRYLIGYFFISSIKPKDIKEIIRNPPQKYRDLIFPEIYKKRIKQI